MSFCLTLLITTKKICLNMFDLLYNDNTFAMQLRWVNSKVDSNENCAR